MTPKNIYTKNQRKTARIRNRYNQVQHLSQDTKRESNKITINITNKSQEVSPFPSGDHKADAKAWQTVPVEPSGHNTTKTINPPGPCLTLNNRVNFFISSANKYLKRKPIPRKQSFAFHHRTGSGSMQLNLSANIFQNLRSFPWQPPRYSELHLHRSSSALVPRRTYGACSNTRRNCILKLSLLGSIGIDHNLRCPSEVFPREHCTTFYILL